MNSIRTLAELAPGQKGTILQLKNTGSIRRRLLDIGLVEHTFVECIGQSPMGDPSAFLIRGAVIALRKEDAKKIMIEVKP